MIKKLFLNNWYFSLPLIFFIIGLFYIRSISEPFIAIAFSVFLVIITMSLIFGVLFYKFTSKFWYSVLFTILSGILIFLLIMLLVRFF